MTKIFVAALLLSWNNYVDSHCLYISPSPSYAEAVRVLETIKQSRRYAIIIIGSMSVHDKIDQLQDKLISPCQYIEKHSEHFVRNGKSQWLFGQ